MATISNDADRVLLSRSRSAITQRDRPQATRARKSFARTPGRSALDDIMRRGEQDDDDRGDNQGGIFDVIGQSLRGGRDVPRTSDVVLGLSAATGTPITNDPMLNEEATVSPEVRGTKALEAVKLTQDMNTQLDALEGQVLTPESQLALTTLREDLEMQLSAAENELLTAQNQLQVQDVLFDFQADQAGLAQALDLMPLNEAIQQEGGLGGQTMKAIMDIANNAALSAAEKDDAVDLIMQRNHFSSAIVEEVANMVQNVKDLENLNSRSDVELLGNAAEFFNPTINFETIEQAPELRFIANFDNSFFEGDWLPPSIDLDHPTMGLYDQLADAVAANGVEFGPIQTQINQLALAWEITPAELRNRLATADNQAKASERAWEDAANAKSLVPGSEGMIAALVMAGEEMGLPPEFLDLIAKSKDLHMIIDVKSGGKAGVTPDPQGTVHGVGGLTDSMYEVLMGEPWSKDKGMQWELQALLKYIVEGFDADPIAAVRFYQQTGEWGGSAGLNNDE